MPRLFLHRVFLAVAPLLWSLFPLTTSAVLTDGANAIDGLGQFDETSISAPVPIFTKATTNNAPNRMGFSLPYGITYDTTRNRLFISDYSNSRVLIYAMNANGTFVDRIPDNILGQPNYYTILQATQQNSLNSPIGGAYDSANDRFFINDSANHRVLVYDVAAITDGENATNVLGQTTFTASAAAHTQNGMNTPTYSVYDSSNNRLIVSHLSTNRVVFYDVASISNGENATNVLGQPNYTLNLANINQNGMASPRGIGYDNMNNRLFVAQQSSNSVLIYDVAAITDGENATNVLGQTTFTASAAANTQNGMNNPQGIAYDSTNNRLFVGQIGNHRVTVYDVAAITNGENATNVLGQTTFTASAAANTQIGLRDPAYIIYESTSNRLFVAQQGGNRVSVFDVLNITNGENAVDLLGQYDESNYTDPMPLYTKVTVNNAPNRLGFSTPIDVAYDTTTNRLFLLDQTNHRVLVYAMNTNGTFVDRIPDNIIGQPNFYTISATNTQNGINTPTGIDYDAGNNRLFISQSAPNRVTVYDVAVITDGENATNVLGQPTFTGTTATNQQNGLNSPRGIAYDSSSNRLYVAQSTGNRVTIYDVTAITNGENAVDLLGQYDESNYTDPVPLYTKVTVNNAPNRLGFSAPYETAYDSVSFRLFLADQTNNRILVYAMNANGTFVDRIPDNVLGQPNFYTNTTVLQQQNTMRGAPSGLAYDSGNNRLFVADRSGNRILVWDVESITNGENAANVLGFSNFTTVSDLFTQASMRFAYDVAYDSVNNRLFAVGDVPDRVMIFDVLAITNGENATNVLGQPNFSSQLTSTQQNGMNNPRSIAYDTTQNRLFVADQSNNRVTVYDVAEVSNGENATNVLGQPGFTTATAANQQNGMNVPHGLAYDTMNNRLFVAQQSGNRVTVYDVAEVSNGENATNVLGQPGFTTATAATQQNGLNIAVGISYDSTNNLLFVADTSNNRAVIYDVLAITNGENAVDAVGQFDETSVSAPVPFYRKSAADNSPNRLGFSAPLDVAVDTLNRRLFVADTTNNRILVYGLNGAGALTDHIPDNILGSSVYYTSTAATQQNGLNVPRGITYDNAGNRLFVAQGTANRVTVYDVTAITDGENAMNVLGQPNYLRATAGTTQNGLSAPYGIAFDSTNQRLHVTDATNQRMIVYDVTGATLSFNPIRRHYFFFFDF